MNNSGARCQTGRLILLAVCALSLGGCAKRADLLALLPDVRPDVVSSCAMDAEGRIVITIENLGGRDAKATTTLLEFDSLPPVVLPTRPVLRGETVTVRYPLPEECYRSDCRYKITVDARGEVSELSEDNNTGRGSCTDLNPARSR